MNRTISSHFLSILESKGIKTLKPSHAHKMIPITVMVHNFASKNLSNRVGIKTDKELPFALVEFYSQDKLLASPLLNDEHCIVMDLVKSESDLEELKRLAREINNVIKNNFAQCNFKLIHILFEFGVDTQDNIALVSDINLDTCSLWDMDNNKKLDKEHFTTQDSEIVLKRILQEGK